MKNDLTDAQLSQEISVKLPLRALLLLGYTVANDRSRITELANHRHAIGSQGLHGIYAGIARADEHGCDHIIEVIAETTEPMPWQKAMDWAASVGGMLPTRKEQALLFANVPELFEKEPHWSCEQYASDAGYAWFQDFLSGYQGLTRKSSSLRARAVRRLNLE